MRKGWSRPGSCGLLKCRTWYANPRPPIANPSISWSAASSCATSWKKLVEILCPPQWQVDQVAAMSFSFQEMKTPKEEHAPRTTSLVQARVLFVCFFFRASFFSSFFLSAAVFSSLSLAASAAIIFCSAESMHLSTMDIMNVAMRSPRVRPRPNFAALSLMVEQSATRKPVYTERTQLSRRSGSMLESRAMNVFEGTSTDPSLSWSSGDPSLLAVPLELATMMAPSLPICSTKRFVDSFVMSRSSAKWLRTCWPSVDLKAAAHRYRWEKLPP
mmetsp:Transcript_18729/g.46821  ORF Transcript_18729/g.46821 Transcript_18729/m.46821 type:complete len:272 (-) Transcript_18729:472-1287(-)